MGWDVEYALYGVTLATIVGQWHFILCVIYEMSKELKIRVFCVKSAQQQRAEAEAAALLKPREVETKVTDDSAEIEAAEEDDGDDDYRTTWYRWFIRGSCLFAYF